MALIRNIAREVFHEQVVDSIALDTALRTFLDSSDGTRAFQGAMSSAILAQGSLVIYLHSPAGVDLLAENIHHWFAYHDFVRDSLCTAVCDQRFASIFAPMVSGIMQKLMPTMTKEQIDLMMPPSTGA